jgi:hypothetical protein
LELSPLIAGIGEQRCRTGWPAAGHRGPEFGGFASAQLNAASFMFVHDALTFPIPAEGAGSSTHDGDFDRLPLSLTCKRSIVGVVVTLAAPRLGEYRSWVIAGLHGWAGTRLL